MNRQDLQNLARIRIREARTLLKAGLPDGAYYLAGYSVECALKACIAKGTRRHDFPDKKRVDAMYTHRLPELVRLAELEAERVARSARDPEFRKNWDLVQQWSEQSRYERHGAASSSALVGAVDNRTYGVLQWLRRHW